jgi:hypothetical protein
MAHQNCYQHQLQHHRHHQQQQPRQLALAAAQAPWLQQHLQLRWLPALIQGPDCDLD